MSFNTTLNIAADLGLFALLAFTTLRDKPLAAPCRTTA